LLTDDEWEAKYAQIYNRYSRKNEPKISAVMLKSEFCRWRMTFCFTEDVLVILLGIGCVCCSLWDRSGSRNSLYDLFQEEPKVESILATEPQPEDSRWTQALGPFLGVRVYL